MNIHIVRDKKDFRTFLDFHKVVYANNQHFRLSDPKLLETLASKKSLFNSHSTILNCLLLDHDEVIGRFMLICDERMPEFVQVAFLEFLPKAGLDLASRIREFARQSFPRQTKICFGLNGHLNHGVGILKNRFDEAPLFGLPYSADYYPDYFQDLKESSIVTFRFDLKGLRSAWEKIRTYEFNSEIKIRKYNQTNFAEGVRVHTYLNNVCFAKHPYWSGRDYGEGYELFEPLRNLLYNDVMIVAEYQGDPIGYLLWFPDFNQLLPSNCEELQCKHPVSDHLREFKSSNRIDTLRIAGIGIVEKFQKKSVDLSLVRAFIETTKDLNFEFCELGYIFKENTSSFNSARKYIHRLFNVTPEIYREFAIYEADI